MAIEYHRRTAWHSDSTVTMALIWLLVAAATLGVAMPLAHWIGSRSEVVAPAVGVPFAPIAESPDFATSVLRDPWDMSEYSDISQYLNESGQRSLVSNPTVHGGIFAGASVGDVSTGNAYFFPLFPGYATATLIGKTGHRYPIEAGKYQCLYTAMKVESGQANSFGPDQFRIFWFSDEWLNGGGPNSPWGQTSGIAIYPEAGAKQPVATWKLFKVNLSTQPNYGTAWSARSTWQGLRIDPTIQAGVSFQVDWVRLTTCTPSLHRVTWTPNTNASVKSLWLRPQGANRYIRVAAASPFGDLNGSSGVYNLDTQGLAPGAYFVSVGADWSSPPSQESTSPLVINQTPIATFGRPSFTSGADYATQAGKPWDFGDAGDVTEMNRFKATSFVSGLLDMVTESGVPPSGKDPEIHLNMPGSLPNSQPFRYLTFRMKTDWAVPWQDVPDGMIARWIWYIPGMTGRQGYECALVSHDIPFDVGWQTYTIDLYDTFNGSPIAYSPVPLPGNDCDKAPNSWASSGAIIRLRLDPNENISCYAHDSKPWVPCSDFHQQLDWIRLTRVDSVKRGTPFPVRISLNVSPSQLTSSTFYYTTDFAGSPQQHLAVRYAPAPPNPGQYSIYLPMALATYAPGSEQPGGEPPGPNDMTFFWDTAGVTPGTYYLCASLADAYNQATYCSEAPVEVSLP